jgi:hypothetical protein
VYEVGNGVTLPKRVYTPDPEYSARRKKINGTVVVAMIVTPEGRVRDVKISKSLDEGLDKQRLRPCAPGNSNRQLRTASR